MKGIQSRSAGLDSVRCSMSLVACSLVALGLGCSGRVSLGELGQGNAGHAAGVTGGSAASLNGGGRPGYGGANNEATGGTDGGASGGTPVTAGTAGSAQGGASAQGGELGRGGAAESCADDLQQQLPLSSNCPDDLRPNGTPCEVSVENGICVWQWELNSTGHAYHAAGCYQNLMGKFWQGVDGFSAGGPTPFAAADLACPKQAPVAGTMCSNASSQTEACIYPTTYCECDAAPGTWSCNEQLAGKTSPPVEVERLCSALDEDLRIADLTPALALQWCQWQARPSGSPALPTVSGRDSPGVADSYAYSVLSTPDGPLCVEELPDVLCVRNLLLGQCTATLRELNDCVETVHAAPLGWVGHGCAPLLKNPSCSKIFVQSYDETSKISHCPVPIK